jgi:hypothetical protein
MPIIAYVRGKAFHLKAECYMRKNLTGIALVLLVGILTKAQAPPAITIPVNGQVFTDSEQVCLSQVSPPQRITKWMIESPSGSGVLLYPSMADLDNGYCLPRHFLPSDASSTFSLTCCSAFAGCTEVECELLPSGDVPPVQPLVLSEVSFRKKDNKYYLRVVTAESVSASSCLSLTLGGQPLPIKRMKPSGLGTMVEAPLGYEDDFVRMASNTPELRLDDHCSQRAFVSRPIPPGKQTANYSLLVYNDRKGIVSRVGSYWLPLTGCEIVFYSWYDASAGKWAMVNYPTFLKYTEHHAPEGLLPHSYRKILKPGILVWRSYDYCTGEFTGFGLGGTAEGILGEQAGLCEGSLTMVEDESEGTEP